MSTVNIALNKPTDASYSVFPYTANKAVDGVSTPLNRWVGSSPLPLEPAIPTPVWLRVNLGDYFWINRWVVKQMGSLGWAAPNYNLVDYKLQGSLDNSNWFDIDSVTNNSASSTDRTVASTKAKWVRIYVTKGLRCNTNFASVADLELYAADPTSAKLTGLTLSAGSLTPPFTGTTYAYTANVGYDNSTITVTPTAEDNRATIKVNGIPVNSGQASGSINLNVGSGNTITVEVTPFIGSPQNYTIAVTRASSPYLTGLVINVGRSILTLSPPFNKSTVSYTASAAATASVSVTATSEDSSARIKINNNSATSGVALAVPVNSGNNLINIVVTSGSGTDQKTYQCSLTIG